VRAPLQTDSTGLHLPESDFHDKTEHLRFAITQQAIILE